MQTSTLLVSASVWLLVFATTPSAAAETLANFHYAQGLAPRLRRGQRALAAQRARGARLRGGRHHVAGSDRGRGRARLPGRRLVRRVHGHAREEGVHRRAARVRARRPALPRHLPRAADALRGQRGEPGRRGARDHPGDGAPLPRGRGARGAADRLERRRAVQAVGAARRRDAVGRRLFRPLVPRRRRRRARRLGALPHRLRRAVRLGRPARPRRRRPVPPREVGRRRAADPPQLPRRRRRRRAAAARAAADDDGVARRAADDALLPPRDRVPRRARERRGRPRRDEGRPVRRARGEERRLRRRRRGAQSGEAGDAGAEVLRRGRG